VAEREKPVLVFHEAGVEHPCCDADGRARRDRGADSADRDDSDKQQQCSAGAESKRAGDRGDEDQDARCHRKSNPRVGGQLL